MNTYSAKAISVSGPIEDLFIYYLSGRLRPQNECLGDAFLGNWYEDGFSFLFFSRPAFEKIKTLLARQPDLTFIDKYQMSYDEWQGNRPAPTTIGRLLIMPPWNRVAADPDRSVILDPGVVFGTGTHPTTRHCLEAIETICRHQKIETLIDIGTGTGLLSLAALKMGCRKALAIDLNFLAVRTAHHNIALNHLQDRMVAVQGRAENFIDIESDLVIANIHYDIMKRLLVSRGFLSKKWFILSGLMRGQSDHIMAELSRLPIQLIKKWHHDGIWHTFLGKNRLDELEG